MRGLSGGYFGRMFSSQVTLVASQEDIKVVDRVDLEMKGSLRYWAEAGIRK